MLNDRYRLLDRLGHGGTAVVWRARNDVLGLLVAIKVLSHGPVDRRSGQLVEQFRRRAGVLVVDVAAGPATVEHEAVASDAG